MINNPFLPHDLVSEKQRERQKMDILLGYWMSKNAEAEAV